MEQSIQVSIHQDPGILLEALFPLLGAAVRKAASAAFQSTRLTLNRFIERSLSLRGSGWRWEALTAGEPLADIALSWSCLFRVAQVLLVHRTSGLVLHNRPAGEPGLLDGGLPAEMLTAMLESDTLRVGESVVWIQHGAQAMLLAVIRGNPPHHVKIVLMNALEHIHQNARASDGAVQGRHGTICGC